MWKTEFQLACDKMNRGYEEFSGLQTIVGGINVPGGWVLSPRLALKNMVLPMVYEQFMTDGQRDLFYTASQMHHIEDLHRRRPSAIAEMSSQTAKTYGITHGEEVWVETDRGQARMRAWVDDRVADGVVLVPHGWQGDGNCNQLTDCREESREPIMGYPTWKSQLCAVRPVAA